MLTCDAIWLERDGFALSADVSFQAGALTALVGPSGAGKSSFLGLVAGFDIPESGDIIWNGTPLVPIPPNRRPVATLFQDNNLFPHLTVEQNIGLGLSPRLKLTPAQRVQVQEVLDQVGLSGLQDRKPGTLSGGQQSRVALARVLLMNRPIVLLDEPFAALGPGLRAEMLDLVRTRLIAPDRVILLVTHDPQDARRAADYIAVVAEGTIGAPQPTAEVFASPSEALRAYLGQ